ncbi:ABC transporter substrate-binding protein [Pseudomonas agarici]|uniref:ABC transporter substrate-binding protein n=1 Tax=Pseudomonas agarici TaxID=46677 RepID=UPI0005849D44|nr:extracellular solute-binding protein [Pseudomonas agarici]NWB91434.1 extracellular solute-binding protein [Pseudomonas agarici]NWC07818.1 extracellular solute-binding protein [Pseudomonas agarici]SEK75293.1 iron(III) transport system substrate-binding protein [Pseudomonas agarici]
MDKIRNKLLLSRSILGAASGLLLALSTPLVQAQDVNSIASYAGADRQDRLIEGAKKEGSLTLYTSVPIDDMMVVTKAFEKKYGIKVRLWRAGSEKVLQRAVVEAQGNRFDVDVIETNGPELESLHREKLLQVVQSPYLADLIPQAIMPHREWVSDRLNIFTQGYNTDQVKQADLPKTYQELLDPRWKGKLGIEAEDMDWFAAVVTELGEEKGLQLFRDLVAKNGVSVRKGHTLLANLVASGEVPLTLTIYNYKVAQLAQKGAPIQWYAIPPAFARPNGVAMANHAPHPNAAVLFFDFMLNEAQPLLLGRQFVPTSKKVETPLKDVPLKFIDSKIILDEQQKWRALYSKIFTEQAQ